MIQYVVEIGGIEYDVEPGMILSCTILPAYNHRGSAPVVVDGWATNREFIVHVLDSEVADVIYNAPLYVYQNGSRITVGRVAEITYEYD